MQSYRITGTSLRFRAAWVFGLALYAAGCEKDNARPTPNTETAPAATNGYSDIWQECLANRLSACEMVYLGLDQTEAKQRFVDFLCANIDRFFCGDLRAPNDAACKRGWYDACAAENREQAGLRCTSDHATACYSALYNPFESMNEATANAVDSTILRHARTTPSYRVLVATIAAEVPEALPEDLRDVGTKLSPLGAAIVADDHEKVAAEVMTRLGSPQK